MKKKDIMKNNFTMFVIPTDKVDIFEFKHNKIKASISFDLCIQLKDINLDDSRFDLDENTSDGVRILVDKVRDIIKENLSTNSITTNDKIKFIELSVDAICGDIRKLRPKVVFYREGEELFMIGTTRNKIIPDLIPTVIQMEDNPEVESDDFSYFNICLFNNCINILLELYDILTTEETRA